MARLKALSESQGLSLYAVAKKSGVSYSTLKMVEQRKGQLSVDTIEHLCSGLGITMSEFFATD